ncbi:MAG: cold-shock protein [Actinomycetota bacterium]
MAQGTVKDYDEGTRVGSLLLDDGSEVGIDATSLEGSEVRMLRLGQRVRFDLADEQGRRMARGLHIVTFD